MEHATKINYWGIKSSNRSSNTQTNTQITHTHTNYTYKHNNTAIFTCEIEKISAKFDKLFYDADFDTRIYS